MQLRKDDVQDEPPLRREEVERGLDAKQVHDVQKEAEDVVECLEETPFVLAMLDVDYYSRYEVV